MYELFSNDNRQQGLSKYMESQPGICGGSLLGLGRSCNGATQVLARVLAMLARWRFSVTMCASLYATVGGDRDER